MLSIILTIILIVLLVLLLIDETSVRRPAVERSAVAKSRRRGSAAL